MLDDGGSPQSLDPPTRHTHVLSRQEHHQRPEGNPRLPAAGGVREGGARQRPPSATGSRSGPKGDPEGFWAEQAETLHWFKPWDKVLDWNEPHAKWFVGGKINASYNCLDRHLDRAAQEQGRHHLGRRAGRHAAC